MRDTSKKCDSDAIVGVCQCSIESGAKRTGDLGMTHCHAWATQKVCWWFGPVRDPHVNKYEMCGFDAFVAVYVGRILDPLQISDRREPLCD